MAKLIVFVLFIIILAGGSYLLLSFIELDFHVNKWGLWARIVFAVMIIISFLMSLSVFAKD